jgi:hypothetical protein
VIRATAGGYLFVGSASRPPYAEAKVLPPSLWTPTSCICELYPEYWALSWCNPSQDAIDAAILELGIRPADFASLQEWVEQQLENGGVGFPGIPLRLEVAQQFAARFLHAGPEIKLLGIGLPESYVDE